jgi:hypothetical protein
MNYDLINFPTVLPVDLDLYFREQLVYFFINLNKNTTVYNDLYEHLYSVLKLLKQTLQNDNKNTKCQKYLELFYRMIGHTRYEKGEHDVSYMLLLTFYDVFPALAIYALHRFVQPINDDTLYGSCIANPYGSWRDMKHLCHYISIQTGSQKHALIDTCIQLMNRQLAHDLESWKYSHYHSREHISNVAKWIPREHKKFDWLFERLVLDWAKTHYPFILRTAYDYDSYGQAILKCKRLYRKTISMLNKGLDTTEIKLCSQKLDDITYVSKCTLMKQPKLNYREHVDQGHGDVFGHGHGDGHGHDFTLYYFVNEAIKLLNHPHDYRHDILNNQWTRFSKSYKKCIFENMIPLLDMSFSNQLDNTESFYNAIGLAILIAEHSSFKCRIMAIDHQPTWINWDSNIGFISIVENIINVSGGTSFRLDKTIDMIIYSANVCEYSTQNMSLVLLSNQDFRSSYDMIISKFDKGLKSIVLWKLSDKFENMGNDSCLTPLRIENAHGNVSFAFKTAHKVGVLNVQMCNSYIDNQGLILLSGFSNCLHNYFTILQRLDQVNSDNNLYITPYNTICQILENPKYNVLGDYLCKLIQ